MELSIIIVAVFCVIDDRRNNLRAPASMKTQPYFLRREGAYHWSCSPGLGRDEGTGRFKTQGNPELA